MDDTRETSLPTPTHHPPEALLIDYASGAMSQAEALMIDIHLDSCPQCRRTSQTALAIGGALLDAIAPARLPPNMLNRTLAAIDALTPPSTEAPKPVRLPAFAAKWPAPLRSQISAKPPGAWRRLPAGFRTLKIPAADAVNQLHIIAAPGGRGPLRHSHGSDEWTVVLEGGYTDETGTYAAGDFAYMGEGDAHTMIAEPGEGCVCLLMMREQPRYLTWLGKLLEPLLRL